MKETLKSKKGITLIALIITIIVLIILAGLSIAVLTGEDGLITKAKQGAQNYQNAAVEEQERLNTLYGELGTQLTIGSTNNSGTSVVTTGSGLTQEEHNAIMSIASMPARGDVNPNFDISAFNVTVVQTTPVVMPIYGYDKIRLKNNGTYQVKYQFVNIDGSLIGMSTNIDSNSDTGYIQIPNDARAVRVVGTTTITAPVMYSLITTDSTYNPDNQ